MGLTGLNVRDSINLMNNIPSSIVRGASIEVARNSRRELEKTGAVVTLKYSKANEVQGSRINVKSSINQNKPIKQILKYLLIIVVCSFLMDSCNLLDTAPVKNDWNDLTTEQQLQRLEDIKEMND